MSEDEGQGAVSCHSGHDEHDGPPTLWGSGTLQSPFRYLEQMFLNLHLNNIQTCRTIDIKFLPISISASCT